MLFGTRRRDRRSLASAFVGEIAAAMETFERGDALKWLQEPRLDCELDNVWLPDFSDFLLPKLAVYEANVGKLSLFDAALTREISYFYTRLIALSGRLKAFNRATRSDPEEMKHRIGNLIEEIDQTMMLGDHLLRSFRGFVSRKQPTSISRA